MRARQLTRNHNVSDAFRFGDRSRKAQRGQTYFDDQAVVFWIGSGTCLGCIRDDRFIPWDDEIETASVIEMHGLDEEML